MFHYAGDNVNRRRPISLGMKTLRAFVDETRFAGLRGERFSTVAAIVSARSHAVYGSCNRRS
jgi:hypothetical protein